MSWDTSQGMAENPGESYGLSDRLVCAKCLVSPRILNPAGITGSSFNITVECHGKRETKFVTKEDLVFTVKFFQEDAEDAGGST